MSKVIHSGTSETKTWLPLQWKIPSNFLGHEILQFCPVFWNWVLALYFFYIILVIVSFFFFFNCLRGKHSWWKLAPLHFSISCLRRSGELARFHYCPRFLFSRHCLWNRSPTSRTGSWIPAAAELSFRNMSPFWNLFPCGVIFGQCLVFMILHT